MRVSIIKGDPGYATFKAMGGYGRIEVLLDGQRIRDCVTADSKTGWVTVNERDDQGNIVVNSKRTAVRRKRLRGRVEIRPA